MDESDIPRAPSQDKWFTVKSQELQNGSLFRIFDTDGEIGSEIVPAIFVPFSSDIPGYPGSSHDVCGTEALWAYLKETFLKHGLDDDEANDYTFRAIDLLHYVLEAMSDSTPEGG